MNELMGGRIFGTGSMGCCRTRPDGTYKESGKWMRPNPDGCETIYADIAPKIRSMNTHDTLPMSRIAQLMEQAAARVLRPRLEDGQTSLTLTMNMTHAVTGPISGNLRAVATFQGANRREYRFLVHVFDESGLVASAEHSRAIVGARRIAGLARKRAGKPSMQLSV
jgi:predicted thioesterase